MLVIVVVSIKTCAGGGSTYAKCDTVIIEAQGANHTWNAGFLRCEQNIDPIGDPTLKDLVKQCDNEVDHGVITSYGNQTAG